MLKGKCLCEGVKNEFDAPRRPRRSPRGLRGSRSMSNLRLGADDFLFRGRYRLIGVVTRKLVSRYWIIRPYKPSTRLTVLGARRDSRGRSATLALQ